MDRQASIWQVEKKLRELKENATNLSPRWLEKRTALVKIKAEAYESAASEKEQSVKIKWKIKCFHK